MYGDEPTPKQIYLALGAGNDDDPGSASSTTVEKLKQSIRTNGGIIQPVILNRRHDGTLVCGEGNTVALTHGTPALSRVLADRSYFSRRNYGSEQAGVTPFAPKPLSSGG